MPGDIIPLIAIPTTAGTGSEVTAFSVITDHVRNYKLTAFSYKLIPKYAILDADFLTTAPARVAAACGIDAMVHAIEAYISRADHESGCPGPLPKSALNRNTVVCQKRLPERQPLLVQWGVSFRGR